MQHDDNTPEHDDTFDLARFEEPPASIVFGDTDDPLFELSVHTATATNGRGRIELDGGQKTALSGLLAQAPALVQSGYVALNSTYRLSFSPDVLSKMAKVMEAQGGQGLRAIALDQPGTAKTMTVIVRLDERGQIAETYHIPDSPQEPVLKPTRGNA